MGLERGIEDLLLHKLVQVQFCRQRIEEFGSPLDRALGRFFSLLQQVLETAMVFFE
jgi:hypothetical protein